MELSSGRSCISCAPWHSYSYTSNKTAWN